MLLGLEKKFDNKLFIFTVLIFFISIFLRIFFLKEFGFFNNDDIAYFKLAENLFSGNGFIFDMGELVPHMKNNHTGNHIHFPPGYPIIIGIESLIFKTPKDIKAFEWIFLGTTNSILLLNLSWFIAAKRKSLAVLLTFLTPVFVYGVGTITIGSENWFLTTSLIGLILCIKFTRNHKLIFLILSNTFFSISYLIRPEGILFYCSSLMASFFYLNNLNKNDNKSKNEGIFDFLFLAGSFLIPLSLIVFPYVIYLYRELGIIALTGKSLNWSELNTLKSSDLSSNYFSNFSALLDVIFTSPYFLGITFSFISLVILITFLIKPKSLYLKNIQRKTKDLLIFCAPLPFCTYSYIKYDPYGRSIFCFIPILIIIVLISSEVYGKIFDYKKVFFIKGRKIIEFSPLISFLTVLSLFNSTYPIFSISFMTDTPTYYYKAVEKVSSNINRSGGEYINIWSRDLTGSLYNKAINTCNDVKVIQEKSYKEIPITVINKKCVKDIDYFLLSDISHDSMPSPTSWEISKLKDNFFTINGVKYKKTFQISDKKKLRKIVVFERFNISQNY